MREASRVRKRSRRRMRHRHPGWAPGPHGRQPPPWPLLLIAVLAMTGATGMVAFTIIAMVVVGVSILASSLPVLMAGTLAFVAVHRRRRRETLRRGGAAGTAPIPGRSAAPPRPDLVWARARARFHALRAEYAAFECDPMKVLRLPALADVSVASTARFVDAFAEAQAMETDEFPTGEHGARFVAAVDRAERAWQAAREAAERIRLSGLSPAERSTVERVIKLLTTARDSDSDPERLAAYARARSELAKLDRAGVIHLPRTAQAALDEASRGALPPRVAR
jgi:hypothetical protein